MDEHRLAKLITRERLGSYLDASGGDLSRALKLYDWNIDLAASALSLTAMVEITLRNALDAQMVEWAKTRSAEPWWEVAPLDPQGKKDVAAAIRRARRGGRQLTHGAVVAELNFGFWRYLMSRKYLTTLWIPALHRAFPGTRLDANAAQRCLERDVQTLLFLRNRAAHHEPLLRRDLADDLSRARRVMDAVDPVALTWLSTRERLSTTAAARPNTRNDLP